jgi:beta-xylosidase
MITQTEVLVYRIHQFMEEEDQNQSINRHASESSTVSIETKTAEYVRLESDSIVASGRDLGYGFISFND